MAKKKDASTTSISGLADTSVLRRSGRETPPSSSSKRQATSPGPLNTRKSERIEKQTTPSSSLIKKKPEKIAKEMGPSPLRRSDRGKKSVVEVPDLPNIKSKKAISSRTSVSEGDVTKEDEKKQSQNPDFGVGKNKTFTAIRYKALFKPQRIRIESDNDVDPKGQDMSPTANASSNEDVDKVLENQNNLRVEEAPDEAVLEENLSDLDQRQHGDCPQTKPTDSKSVGNDNDVDPKGQDMSPTANASSNEDVDKVLENQNNLRFEEAPDKAVLEEYLSDLDQRQHGGCPQTKPPDSKSVGNGNVEKQIGGNISPSNTMIADNDNHIFNTSSPSRINQDLEKQQELQSCHKVTVMENNLQNCGSIFNSSKFVEFWVPVEISNVQLEQYCKTLLENAMALRSCSKSDTLGALNTILVDNRKCCNHPYIMNPKLQQLLVKDFAPSTLLDVGIQASGKLQFLDLILPEVQKRQLRVLILFQTASGTFRANGYYSLGDILADYVHERFGQDSFEQVNGFGSISSKKQAAISIFNKELGRFIFLVESRALHPSIKLSSIDIIIIFDSDLHPANDLRALQKIHIDSQSEQIMIFRLYSSSTLEEKILKLAEQNLAIDIRPQSLRSNYDALLMWGASDLFDKLTDFHNQSVVSISSHDSTLKDVVEEFVCIIDKSKNKDTSKSIITRLQSCGKTIPLHSEMKTYLQDGDLPHIFWRNLLGGRSSIFKFVSESTPRQRKRPNYFLDSSSKGTSVDAGGARARRKTTANNNTIEAAKLKPVIEEGETGCLKEGASGVPAHNESQSSSGDWFWSTAVTNETSLYDLLKPTVFELCNILKFSEDVKVIVERFLKYVIENYNVSKEPESLLQAFMISLCWIGSSLAQLKIDRRESFALAKKHFDFTCMEDQTNSVYEKLKPVKEMFLQHSGIPTDTLKDGVIPGPGSQGAGRLEEETEKRQEHTQSESSNHEEEANRCVSQTEHLSCKEDQQEINKFNKEWESTRISLENDYQVDKALICMLHLSNPSIRSEKLKLLDKEFTNKLEQHKRSREIHLEDLKAKLVSSHGENQVVAAPSAQSNNIESTGSHTSGKQMTDATVSLIGEALAPQIYDDMDVDDVAGKVDLGMPEVDSHQENATATSRSPNGSHANATESLIGEALAPQIYDDMEVDDVAGKVELGVPEVDFHQENANATSRSPNGSHAVENRSETGVNVESADMGMPAGDCYKDDVAGKVDLGVMEVDSHQENGTAAASSSPNGSHAVEHRSETGVNVESADMGMPAGDCYKDDVAGKVDLGVMEVDSHQENGATAASSSPNGSHAVEHRSETGVNVESGDMGIPAGDCYKQNADTSSHAVQDCGPNDNEVALPVPAEMGTQAANCDKEKAVICPSDMLHAGEEDHNEINMDDSAVMGTPTRNCNDEIGPDDAAHDAAEEHDNDSCGSSSNPPSIEAVSQGNTASVEPVAPVAIIPEIQNESLVERCIEVQEGEGSPGNVDNVQPLGDGSEIDEIVPEEDQLLDPRNDEDITLSDGNLEHGVAEGERQPSSVTALDMFDNLNNRVGSRMPNQTVDPLQTEVERLYEVKDTVTKFHEETKQRLTSECEKEIAEMIAQISLKYEGKRQEAEAAYEAKKKELDTNINRVIMNKILAEAFRSKCQDLTTTPHSAAAAAPGTTQQVSQAGLLQQLHRSAGQPLIRRSQGTASSSPAQYSGSQQALLTPPRPPLQIVHQPAALFSSGTPPSSHNTNLRSPAFTTPIRPPPNTNPAIPNTRPSTTPTTTRPPPPPHIVTLTTTPTTTRPPPAINPSSMSNGSQPSINSNISAANLRINAETRGQVPHLRSSVNNGEVLRAPAPHLRPLVSSEIRAPAPHIRPFRPGPPPDYATQQRTLPTSHFPLTSTSNSQPSLSSSSLPPEPYTVPPPPPASSSSWLPSRSHSPQKHPPSGVAATSSHAQLPRTPTPPLASPDNLENAGRWHNILTPPPDLSSEIDMLNITDFIQESNAGPSAHDLVYLSDDD